MQHFKSAGLIILGIILLPVVAVLVWADPTFDFDWNGNYKNA